MHWETIRTGTNKDDDSTPQVLRALVLIADGKGRQGGGGDTCFPYESLACSPLLKSNLISSWTEEVIMKIIFNLKNLF